MSHLIRMTQPARLRAEIPDAPITQPDNSFRRKVHLSFALSLRINNSRLGQLTAELTATRFDVKRI